MTTQELWIRAALLAVFAVVTGPSGAQAQCRQGQKSPTQFPRGLQQQSVLLQQLQQLQQQTLVQTALQRQVQQNNVLIDLLNKQQSGATNPQLQTAIQAALQQTALLLTSLAQQNVVPNPSAWQSGLQQQVSLLAGLSQ